MRGWSGWIMLGLALGLLGTARPAAAQTIIGNLPQANDSAGLNLDGARKAISFTMGPTPYLLTAVRLRLRLEATDTPGFVHLLNDSGADTPGTTQVEFHNPTFTTGRNTYAFAPTSSRFILQANTKYWLQVVGTRDNAWTWTGSSPGITPTGLGATYGTQVSSTDDGASWGSSSVVNSFEIQGTAVPEPSAVLLFLPALAAVAVLRRRSSR